MEKSKLTSHKSKLLKDALSWRLGREKEVAPTGLSGVETGTWVANQKNMEDTAIFWFSSKHLLDICFDIATV